MCFVSLGHRYIYSYILSDVFYVAVAFLSQEKLSYVSELLLAKTSGEVGTPSSNGTAATTPDPAYPSVIQKNGLDPEDAENSPEYPAMDSQLQEESPECVNPEQDPELMEASLDQVENSENPQESIDSRQEEMQEEEKSPDPNLASTESCKENPESVTNIASGDLDSAGASNDTKVDDSSLNPLYTQKGTNKPYLTEDPNERHYSGPTATTSGGDAPATKTVEQLRQEREEEIQKLQLKIQKQQQPRYISPDSPPPHKLFHRRHDVPVKMSKIDADSIVIGSLESSFFAMVNSFAGCA